MEEDAICSTDGSNGREAIRFVKPCARRVKKPLVKRKR
jgi:hypothetical protein